MADSLVIRPKVGKDYNSTSINSIIGVVIGKGFHSETNPPSYCSTVICSNEYFNYCLRDFLNDPRALAAIEGNTGCDFVCTLGNGGHWVKAVFNFRRDPNTKKIIVTQSFVNIKENKLIDLNNFPSVQEKGLSLVNSLRTEPKADTFRQNDSSSCGPVAILNMIKHFHKLPDGVTPTVIDVKANPEVFCSYVSDTFINKYFNSSFPNCPNKDYFLSEVDGIIETILNITDNSDEIKGRLCDAIKTGKTDGLQKLLVDFVTKARSYGITAEEINELFAATSKIKYEPVRDIFNSDPPPKTAAPKLIKKEISYLPEYISDKRQSEKIPVISNNPQNSEPVMMKRSQPNVSQNLSSQTSPPPSSPKQPIIEQKREETIEELTAKPKLPGDAIELYAHEVIKDAQSYVSSNPGINLTQAVENKLEEGGYKAPDYFTIKEKMRMARNAMLIAANTTSIIKTMAVLKTMMENPGAITRTKDLLDPPIKDPSLNIPGTL